jgi:glucose/arabinose dehydrogenase
MIRATAVVVGTLFGIATLVAGAAPSSSSGDWTQDRPGREHRIDLSELPPPFASKLATNRSKVVPKPANAHLEVPPGFAVRVAASGLDGPRTMRLAPNGDLFVAETEAGRIVVLHPSADGRLSQASTFASGLVNPFGMQFYPRNRPQWLYVAETNRVVRYPYREGDGSATGAPEVIVPELAPEAGSGHVTRDLVFTPDERRMFVSVGSRSNVAEQIPKKTAAEVRDWQANHALGAAWADETNRADVLQFEVGPGGGVNGAGRVYATGLRNCAGLTIQPDTHALWCTVNERDMLGDNLVPDYSTRVREGGFYGWPWYYMGDHEDPRLKGERPDLAGKVTLPDVPYQSHSAPLNLVFYTASHGAAAFPEQYDGDGFAVLHGSWNRENRTGYKVVRVRMNNGVPTGEYDDFMVGFVVDAADVWGRPVGALEDRDGSLLISDDGGNVIYRISYQKQ